MVGSLDEKWACWKSNILGETDHEFIILVCLNLLCLTFLRDFQVEMSPWGLDSWDKKPEERSGLDIQDYDSCVFRL